MATLQQVADRAGVALSTVSFVLNDNPRVSPETREVVFSAVKELNYKLGRKGRPRRGKDEAPVRRRKHMVAFLIPFSETTLRMSAVYLRSVESAMAALAKGDRGMVIHRVTQHDAAGEASWLQSKVDGALMILQDSAREVSQIVARIPTVRLMGQPTPGAPWDHITYDNTAIGGLAARYLLERGHRHCAFLSPHLGTPPGVGYGGGDAVRERTFIEGIRAGGASVRMNTSGFSEPNSPEPIRQALQELLLPEPRPTGLFIPRDDFTLMAYGLLFSMGLRPGTDLEVISCNNDLAIVRGLHPRPANIDIHTAWIAASGVGQLLQRLEAPDLPRSLRLFEPTLIPSEYPWPAT